MEVEYVEGAAETAGMSADVVNEGGEDAVEEKVDMEAAHVGSEKVVVCNVVGDAKEVINLEAIGEGDNAAATKQTGVKGPTETTAGQAGGERSRKKKAMCGHPGSSASGRQPPLDVIEQLRQENRRLMAENARLKAHGEERGRVAVSDRNAAKRLLDATSAESTTITDNITNQMDESWKAMKSFTEKASTRLTEIDGLEGSMAVERTKVVIALANHEEAVVDDAKLGLEDYISKHLAAAQTNIAAVVTHNIAMPPPPPPQPTLAFPDELMKLFTADVLKAVTEATQQSFVASGLKLMTEVIGNVAPGRRGSSPSANDADPAQRREADKQGQKRAGGRDDTGSVKRSKGADGIRGVGVVGLGGSRTRGQSVVDQLKKNGAKVIRSHSKGDGIGSADGGHADEVAAQDAGPTASALVAKKPHGLASGGKGLSDKEIPTAQTAIDGGARTVKGPSYGVAGTTSIPRKPPTASSAPVGPSAANNDGPALAATLAPAGPSAAKGNAKDAAANRDSSSATKVPAVANALREMLHRMEAHRKDVQQPPLVDAAPAETARRSVTLQVAATTPSAPHTAPLFAVHPPADPKSALLCARLGTRSAAVPTRTQPKVGSSATPTSVNVAVEKGVRAALATGGGAVDPAQASKGHNDANIDAIQNLLEAVKRPGHPPALAISDTAHVEPSASPPGGSAEPKTTTDAGEVGGERKVEENQEKSVGEGTSAKKGKEKVAEKEKEKAAEKEKEKKKEKEKEKEKGRKGHGIRHDNSGDGLGWVGEIKVLGTNRYIGKSRDKMELAYLHSIAYIVYDGYVSKVLMAELTGLEETELEKWWKVWEEIKFLPIGMWTVIWARGAYLPKTRFDDILGKYRAYKSSGDAHHDALLPAIWFPFGPVTKEGKEKLDAMMSAIEEIGIAVPCDAQMEYDIEHRGRKGQRGKQGRDSTAA
ncbi:unnamed protein product [Closterium sp. NIES-53]